jgi:hypothetical protein
MRKWDLICCHELLFNNIKENFHDSWDAKKNDKKLNKQCQFLAGNLKFFDFFLDLWEIHNFKLEIGKVKKKKNIYVTLKYSGA